MSENHYILAHDLGTTGNKATLFDIAGVAVASTFEEYETAYARPNWAEQDAADWRQILADVYNLPILLPGLTAEATALGAAIAGGVGVGLFPDFSVARHFIPTRAAE